MRTENFSSAATTTSTIDSESTSRSSVNDFSSWTSPAGMPVTSLTISASSVRISSVVAISGLPLVTGTAGVGCESSGDADHLGGEGEPRAEGDQQCQVAALRGALVVHPGQCQRDRGGRGV